jgi:HlyD family secretion protein
VKARVGEYYTPGASEAPVVLGDTRRLRVRMDVDERDIGRVRVGLPAYAVVDAYPGARFAGKVAEIGRRMGRKNVRTDDPTERLDTKILEVVIDLDDAGKLVPGLRVVSYIEAGK